LVRVAPDGTPLAAYDLGNNHHAVIWEKDEPEPDGSRRRDMTVVSMLEAARRATLGKPVFDRTPPADGWHFVMGLCKDDVVAWTGERAGLVRVANFTRGTNEIEIRLRPRTDAKASQQTHIRVRTAKALCQIAARVCLDPLGEAVAWEPPDADRR